ncbi:hypothetical protein Sarmat_00916 [Rickettsiales endosymbiont of Paramecium tredecaurelia]|nr:hypothetical protein [Candidatus Sarmatiella mevalonica]
MRHMISATKLETILVINIFNTTVLLLKNARSNKQMAPNVMGMRILINDIMQGALKKVFTCSKSIILQILLILNQVRIVDV